MAACQRSLRSAHRYTGMVRQTTPYCDVNNGGYLWMNVDSAYISWSMIPHTTKYRRRVSPCSDVWIVSYPPYPHRKILEKCHLVNIYVDKSPSYPQPRPYLSTHLFTIVENYIHVTSRHSPVRCVTHQKMAPDSPSRRPFLMNRNHQSEQRHIYRIDYVTQQINRNNHNHHDRPVYQRAPQQAFATQNTQPRNQQPCEHASE